MKLDIDYKKDKIILKNAKDFIPRHIFECGQCFRWNENQDSSFTGVAHNRVISVQKLDKDIIIENSTREDFENIWIKYFDLGTDYGIIKNKISQDDEVMQKAIEFGKGIRILRQEPWETLVSFIISANNNIPRIKKTIELLAGAYGEYLGEFHGEKRYGFPTARVLSQLSIEELKACNLGYRAAYIQKTASMLDMEPTELDEIARLDIVNCKKNLLKYQGVGPKVAHCVLFFCMGKMQAFPVDVWVKRVMEYFYFHREASPKEIQEFAWEKFGKYAGYAQQYLFYYARELGIGKG